MGNPVKTWNPIINLFQLPVPVLALFVIFGNWKPPVAEGGFLEDVCLKPIDEGKACPSGKPQSSYGFSRDVEQCIPFDYKGCEGNKNRFGNGDDCTDSCQVEWFRQKNKKKKKGELEEESKTKDDCKGPAEPGPCRAAIQQWHWDEKAKKCKSFMYGGCKGSRNRFNEEDDCKSVCS